MATIQSGILTFTILSGTTTVNRANGSRETITGPVTIEVNAGDQLTEGESMVHFGANNTGEPVVILATLLTESGRDLAVVVTTTIPR